MSDRYSKGIYFALLTASISGFSIFINKFAVDIVKPPLVFTTSKNIGVGLLIIAFLLLSRKLHKIKGIAKKDAFALVLIGVLGGSLPFYLYFTGLSQVPAINAALLHNTLVFWVALLALPFLKERLSKIQLFAVLLIFLGNLSIGGFKGFLFSQGELFILFSTILWAVENVIAKKILPRIDPDILTAARMGIGGVILLGASIIVAPHGLANMAQLNPTQWLWLSISVILLLGYVTTWYRALSYAPAVTVTSILTLATLVTNVLSVLFVTHHWTVQLSTQSLLMLVGAILFWWITIKQKQQINVLEKSS